MTAPARLLIDGRLVEAADGLAFPVVEPASGREVGRVPDAGAADLDRALDAALAARVAWSADPHLRSSTVGRLREAVAESWSDLRDLVTREVGTPGEQVPEPSYAEVGRDPVGVLAVVTPWTSPVLALEAIVPALLAGDVVVHKPAAGAGWFACEVGRIAAEEAGLPPGVLQVLPSRDVDVPIALTTDARVDGVWFAGSAVAAERVAHQAADRIVHLEAGRPSTVVVREGPDVARVAGEVMARLRVRAGQECGAPARLLVPRASYDVAVTAATRAAAGEVAPMGSRVHRDRVRRYLALAEHEGGALHATGEVPGEGWWVAPTVVTGLAPSARMVHEEVLGPVLLVLAHDGDGEDLAGTIPSYDVEVL